MKNIVLLLAFFCTVLSYSQNTVQNSTDLQNAEAHFYLKNYRKALYHYKAVAKDTSQHYAISQVELIHTIIDSNKTLFHEQHLNELIALADSTFEIGNLLSSEYLYNRSQQFSPTLVQPQKRIIEINQLNESQPDTLSSSDKNMIRLFRKLLNKADSEFDKGKYERAYNLYQRAIGIEPTTFYARQMIKIIDDITSEIK